MTITVPLLEAPPSPSPPLESTQGPRGCNVEVSTQINIPFTLTPEMLAGKRHGNGDPGSDMGCVATTTVSVKFTGGSHTVHPSATPVPPAAPAAPAPPVAPVHTPAPAALPETVPAPDETFIIRHPESGHAIRTTGGEVHLADVSPDNWTCHWTCFENNGWLGFRNRASRMVLGHDSRGGLHARVTHHKAHEWFQVRRHPDGGDLLLVKHKDDLWRVDVGGDTRALVEKKDGGVRWEFEKA